METFIMVVIFFFTCGGYIAFSRNIWNESMVDFVILPWITFTFLAGLDLSNIIFSEERGGIEIFSGLLMFLGPATITFLILLQGIQKQNKTNKIKFFIQKVSEEYTTSKSEPLLLAIGGIILIGLITADQFTQWGNSYFNELIFAILTIFLDLVASFSLLSEIRRDVKKFETKSWSMWTISATIAYILNVSKDANPLSIGSILIIESACISCIILIYIFYFRKYDTE